MIAAVIPTLSELEISEVSDSLTIIVSEETGAVSLAKDGRLYKHLQKEELVEKLQQLKVDDTGNADVFKKWKDLLRNEKSDYLRLR